MQTIHESVEKRAKDRKIGDSILTNGSHLGQWREREREREKGGGGRVFQRESERGREGRRGKD